MKPLYTSIFRILISYLLYFPIYYLVGAFFNLLGVNDLPLLRWFGILVLFLWFFLAGFILKNAKWYHLLWMYPALTAMHLMKIAYFPMIVYGIVVATLALALTRKELTSRIRMSLGLLFAVFFCYLLLSQPLILRKKGFGYDANHNLVNATLVWDLSESSLQKLHDEVFLTAAGNTFQLDAIKGKTAFVSFWSASSTAFLNEAAKLESLKRSLKEYNNIVFVDVCLDTNERTWKEVRTALKLSGLQLLSRNSSLTRANYGLTTLPQYILANQGGYYKACHSPTSIDWTAILPYIRFVDAYVATSQKIVTIPPK